MFLIFSMITKDSTKNHLEGPPRIGLRHFSTIFDIIRQYSTLFDNIRQYSTLFDNIQKYST